MKFKTTVRKRGRNYYLSVPKQIIDSKSICLGDKVIALKKKFEIPADEQCFIVWMENGKEKSKRIDENEINEFIQKNLKKDPVSKIRIFYTIDHREID